jgi:hypothetical protein
MKSIFSLFLVSSLALFSCGKVSPKGNVETKTFPVQDYSKLDLDGKFRVFYVKTDSNAVEVETYPNLMDNLDIHVKDKQLFIHEKRESGRVDFYNLTIYSTKNMDQISLSDSVEFNGSTEIKANDFQLKLNKTAKFIGALRSKNATIEMNGHSLANIKGYTQNAFFKLSDSASIIAPFWEINVLDLEVKNGAYAEAKVLDTLKGNLRNTSSLLYYSTPIMKLKKDNATKVTNKLAP